VKLPLPVNEEYSGTEVNEDKIYGISFCAFTSPLSTAKLDLGFKLAMQKSKFDKDNL
jgi:hypothetical protein